MRKVVVFFLKGYKFLISPLLGGHCRFQPTCSEYAMQAVTKHGVFRGIYLSLNRICRCRPGADCGYDPVPAETGTCNRHSDHPVV